MGLSENSANRLEISFDGILKASFSLFTMSGISFPLFLRAMDIPGKALNNLIARSSTKTYFSIISMEEAINGSGLSFSLPFILNIFSIAIGLVASHPMP
ncbi:MAG: hypothetical protein AMQ22_00666 [Candidatus Methanofastidiosum methylothiophilum]|uniref:Uncharacterized protein n=1 Tax=Candidatus Methanofastidiosum methylothiophilum TaxID=1705564 RepID=A0A150J654_9EURY|nr:MAG: hypothetical protein AMQ22_00666 [Candidatus Methanofastidiosum methylthiophilus]